ncbi:sigma-70 family RNA polymerase sigma factor [Hymenobacter arcticus]
MRLPKQEEEHLLIQRLYARDELAMTHFYQQYKPALYYRIFRVVRQAEQAEDILQECMLKFWLAFPTYDVNKGRLYTWALSIGHNLAIDSLRKQRQTAPLTHALSEELAAGLRAPTLFYPEHIGVREWAGRLSPADQQLVDLLYFQGYTQVETSQMLALPLGTIKSRSRRIIRTLTQAVT